MSYNSYMLTDYERQFCSKCRKENPTDQTKWRKRRGGAGWCAEHQRAYQRQAYQDRLLQARAFDDNPSDPVVVTAEERRTYCAKCRKHRSRDEWSVKAPSSIYCVEHRREMNRQARGYGSGNVAYSGFDRLPANIVAELPADDREIYYQQYPDERPS